MALPDDDGLANDANLEKLRAGLLAVITVGVVIFVAGRLFVHGELAVDVNEHLWQVADSAFLTGKPFWSSVLSYHAQPPGLLILQWLEVNGAPGTIGISLLFASLIVVCGCGAIVFGATRSRLAGSVAAAFVGFHPSTFLYGFWFFSPIYLSAALTSAIVCLIVWVHTEKAVALCCMLFGLSLATLFHAGFLPLFAVGGAALVAYAIVSKVSLANGKVGGLLVIGAICIAVFPPVKNLLLFDSFMPSSWGKLNLSLLYSRKNAWNTCTDRVLNANRLDEIAAIRPEISDEAWADEDLLFSMRERTGGVNMNHYEIILCARRVRLFQNIDPVWILKRVALASYEFLALPSWDYPDIKVENFRRLRWLVTAYELFIARGNNPRYLYLGRHWRSKSERLLRSLSVPTVLFSFLLAVCFAAHLRRTKRLLAVQSMDRSVMAVSFAWMMLAVVVATLILANGQEMNRLRFPLTPLLSFVAADALWRFWKPKPPP